MILPILDVEALGSKSSSFWSNPTVKVTYASTLFQKACSTIPQRIELRNQIVIFDLFWNAALWGKLSSRVQNFQHPPQKL